MKSIEDVNELHNILLEIALDFHRICEKYSIPYYMLGGTMLGAVRHEGFIPWDDDMDFGVPRKYFNLLKDVLSKECDTNFKVCTIQNTPCPGLIVDIIKLCDKRTIISELYKENLKEPLGVNIDIFPLDFAQYDRKSIRNKFISFLISLQAYRFFSVYNRKNYKKIIAYIIKICFFPLKYTTIPHLIESKLVPNKGNFLANYYGAWGEKEIVDVNVMGNPILYKFNGYQFYGVSNSHKYLHRLYGDYMQLPPLNKRHIHLKDIFWK